MKSMQLALATAGVVVLLMLAGATAFWTVRLTAENARSQAQALNVLAKLNGLSSDIADAETAQRGYLLTADESYLQPYMKAVPQIVKHIGELRELAAANAAQRQRLDALQPLIDAKLAGIEEIIVQQRRGNALAAQEIVRSGKGKDLMDSIRREIGQFEHEERAALIGHNAGFESSIRYMIAAIAVLGLLIVAIIGTTVYRLRQLGQRLQHQAAFQQALLDSANAAIVSTTPDGIIDSFNRGAESMFGYSAAELVGKPVVSMLSDVNELAPHAEKLSRELGREIKPGFEVLVALAREGRDDTREWLVPRKDGVRVPTLLSVSAIRSAQGALTGFIGIARDISGRKQAEMALIAAKEAAELANRGKDTFLATMSHEIRTPLGGIQGLLELLSLTPLDREQRTTLQTARESANGLLRILNDILDWSSLEAGKLQLVPQAASIAQTVAKVANTYAHAASAKNLTLEQRVDTRLGAAHVFDPLRLSQVLNNFVSNAIKFTLQGKVELRAELMERLEGADRVRFSVSDTGVGIDKGAQAQVFERYAQQTAGTGRMYGGTGLGLSICRRLAQAMNAAIDLDSTPGAGSTFSLTLVLPAAPTTSLLASGGDDNEASPQPLAFAQDTRKTAAPVVLVVDDNSVNRMILAAQLGRLGVTSEIAENGEAALALWQQKRFAMVITDCHMPKMDGYQLARTIRGIETAGSKPRTPILAWTANAMPAEADACRDAGMDELLVKPLALPQLKEVLTKWLHTDSQAAAHGEGVQGAAQDTGNVPVDLTQLDHIAADEAQKSTILSALLTQSRSDLSDLKAALEKGDVPATVRIAHRMKGASRMVGANELASASEAMELAGKQGRIEHTEKVLPALARLMQWLESQQDAPPTAPPKEVISAADGLLVMVVEDHDFQRQTVAGMLRAMGAREVLEAADGRHAVARMTDTSAAPVDLVICDLDMPNMDGMEFMRHLGLARHPASVIITSAKERALLSSVAQMAKAYGITLLGVIEKPVTREALEAQIEAYSQPRMLSNSQKILRVAAPEAFTLNDVLPGLAQQIEPFFQPKMQVATGKIVGAEALARWRHPQRGIIAPYAFIPLLEQSGNIDALTFLMLEKSAAACYKWRAAGVSCNVSVNLSLASLADTSLADRITRIVKDTGLSPHDMTLEVTETTAMTDVAPALENLTRLRMHGFGLSIDDYGTGFSSMQQLTRVPFTELKIDQSFVRGFSANSRLRPIVESSVEMARRLNIKSVAEGAESQEDWDALKAIGCDLVQGYFVARPLDEASFVKFCAEHEAGATAGQT